ncbi:MAG: T9SS type A sorting domain-containing protein [Ferruginibacter sp.]
MKRKLLLPLFSLFAGLGLNAQVTQINSNRSLSFEYPLTNNKSVYVSSTDNTIWATDGTLAGTIQLSATIKFVGGLGSTAFLNGKLIFSGTTPATGAELYITDGTIGGTVLVDDINPGAPGSAPDNDFALLNGFIYFTAERPAEGRELWRTNGTLAGTSLVKDIVPGPVGSNTPGSYELFSSGTYLLFAARTPTSGIELWKSDGTEAGTNLFLDINTGHSGADSSTPRNFYLLNNVVLFEATDATHGEEVWRTNGTVGGTFMLADINPGPGSSTKIEILPGFNREILISFHRFNNRAYFTAYNGTSTGQVWGTDGSIANTSLLKDVVPGVSISFIVLPLAVNFPNKFIFAISDLASRSELWQSDGTPAGTVLFKAFTSSATNSYPIIFVPFGTNDGVKLSENLFQGNKFFFTANTAAEGNELWISDGVDATASHTHIVRDINPGTGDGMEPAQISYTYTTAGLYFPANNGANGSELWKSDGTSGNTSMVSDIITGLPGSEPHLEFFLINNKILFEADNGDDPNEKDLYAVDGAFLPLPISLGSFTVKPTNADAVLNWRTLLELDSKDFTVQRSFDGLNFKGIGTVPASGTSSNVHEYSFIDAGIMNSGKNIVYYRLLTTDKNGKSALSPVITLKLKNTGKWEVHLLVNPVPDNVKLILSGITENVQLSIIDMNGKQFFTSLIAPVNGQISLPTAGIPHGSYVLLAETANEKKTIRFIK